MLRFWTNQWRGLASHMQRRLGPEYMHVRQDVKIAFRVPLLQFCTSVVKPYVDVCNEFCRISSMVSHAEKQGRTRRMVKQFSRMLGDAGLSVLAVSARRCLPLPARAEPHAGGAGRRPAQRRSHVPHCNTTVLPRFVQKLWTRERRTFPIQSLRCVL